MGLDRKHVRLHPGKKTWRDGVDTEAAERIEEAEHTEDEAPPERVKWRKQLRREMYGRGEEEEN